MAALTRYPQPHEWVYDLKYVVYAQQLGLTRGVQVKINGLGAPYTTLLDTYTTFPAELLPGT